MRSRVVDQFATIVTLVVIVAGLIVVALGPWRIGVGIVGSAVLGAGIARWWLPNRYLGDLRVRSRVGDGLFLVLSGAAIIILAVIVPPPE